MAFSFASILSRSRAGLELRVGASKSLAYSHEAGPVWVCETRLANGESSWENGFATSLSRFASLLSRLRAGLAV